MRVDFSILEQSVRAMGAQIRHVDLTMRALDPLSELRIKLEEGVEVELKEVKPNAGGLLSYKGFQVVLYIPDQGRSLEKALEDPTRGKKVHVAECDTLQHMREIGRFERYVARNGLSQDFTVSGMRMDGTVVAEAIANLLPCQNCLKKLNYRNFLGRRKRERHKEVREFTLADFFATYSSYFSEMPRRSADDLQANSYTNDWNEISERFRNNAKWRCSSCEVDLREHRHLLHVHHLSGDKADNSNANLQALCADCHSKQAMHETMFVRRADRQLIQNLRQAQGAYHPPKKDASGKQDWEDAFKFADPAVHGLLHLCRQAGHPVPEVGYDVVAGQTRRVIFSNAELAWPDYKEVVVLDASEAEVLSDANWTVFTPQGLIDQLSG